MSSKENDYFKRRKRITTKSTTAKFPFRILTATAYKLKNILNN